MSDLFGLTAKIVQKLGGDVKDCKWDAVNGSLTSRICYDGDDYDIAIHYIEKKKPSDEKLETVLRNIELMERNFEERIVALEKSVYGKK